MLVLLVDLMMMVSERWRRGGWGLLMKPLVMSVTVLWWHFEADGDSGDG